MMPSRSPFPKQARWWPGGRSSRAAGRSLPGWTVLRADRRRLLECRDPLRAAEKGRGLRGPDGPSCSDCEGYRRHRDVVRGVDDHRHVVLSVRVSAGQYPGTEGIVELLAHDFQAVLWVFDL